MGEFPMKQSALSAIIAVGTTAAMAAIITVIKRQGGIKPATTKLKEAKPVATVLSLVKRGEDETELIASGDDKPANDADVRDIPEDKELIAAAGPGSRQVA